MGCCGGLRGDKFVDWFVDNGLDGCIVVRMREEKRGLFFPVWIVDGEWRESNHLVSTGFILSST